MGTATAVAALWLHGRRLPLPKMSMLALHHVGAMVVLQVSLGIATLVYFVPISLASAHQAGSLTLLTFATWLAHTLRRAPRL
jgi:heme a synthase